MTDLTALDWSEPLPCIDLINHVTTDYHHLKENFLEPSFWRSVINYFFLFYFFFYFKYFFFFYCCDIWSTTAGAERFTLAAVAILGELQAVPAAPAVVGSRTVRAQLARADAGHQALVDIWKEGCGHTGLPPLA